MLGSPVMSLSRSANDIACKRVEEALKEGDGGGVRSNFQVGAVIDSKH